MIDNGDSFEFRSSGPHYLEVRNHAVTMVSIDQLIEEFTPQVVADNLPGYVLFKAVRKLLPASDTPDYAKLLELSAQVQEQQIQLNGLSEMCRHLREAKERIKDLEERLAKSERDEHRTVHTHHNTTPAIQIMKQIAAGHCNNPAEAARRALAEMGAKFSETTREPKC